MDRRSVSSLFATVKNGTPLTTAVRHDYFGIPPMMWMEHKAKLLLAIYADMITNRGLTMEVADAHFRANRLDLLICETYRQDPTPEFRRYIDERMGIGKTFYGHM
jgi:hypothetical protein